MKKNCKSQTWYKVEKSIKIKSNKLYDKRKGYDDPFNSSIDKKYIIK